MWIENPLAKCWMNCLHEQREVFGPAKQLAIAFAGVPAYVIRRAGGQYWEFRIMATDLSRSPESSTLNRTGWLPQVPGCRARRYNKWLSRIEGRITRPRWRPETVRACRHRENLFAVAGPKRMAGRRGLTHARNL